MIEPTLSFLAAELDARLRSPGAEALVVLSALVGPDGAAVPGTADRLAMFLVGVERETETNRPLRRIGPTGGLPAPAAPRLTLLVMVAANFTGPAYAEGLKRLDAAIDIFEAQPIFDHATSPALDPAIASLSMTMDSLGLAQLSQLWAMQGGRYTPSVLYRVEVIPA